MKDKYEIKNILNILLKHNDTYIINEIENFLGYQCDRCYKYTSKKLTIVLSFGDGKENYNFKVDKKTNYELKKFCDNCIYCNSSPCKIYVEVPQYKKVDLSNIIKDINNYKTN